MNNHLGEILKPSVSIRELANILESEMFAQPNVEVGHKSQPFLSVVLRTQGQRTEQLSDALLCLSAQTSDDFELIVVLHDSPGNKISNVETIIRGYDESFVSRTRLLSVEGGSRARPLNVGLKSAQGRYIAFFDDDDYLFAHWVESFKSSEELASGKVLRTQCAIVDSAIEYWPQNSIGTRSLEWPKMQYPSTFSFVDHLTVNKTPFMSVAFPVATIRQFHIEFNEDLPVCEDWDFLLRVTHKTDVLDIEEVTSIYRRWSNNLDTSYSKHGISEWNAAEKQIRDYWNSRFFILPPGSVQRFNELAHAEAREHSVAAKAAAYQSLEQSLYWKLLSPLRFSRRIVRRLLSKTARGIASINTKL